MQDFSRKLRCAETLEARLLLIGESPVISEFMASNRDTIRDAFGDSADWLEVWNPSSQEVDLTGWHLTDDANRLFKWTFPVGTSLQAGEHKIVWASDRNVVDARGGVHTNFRLKASGEFLALVDPAGVIISAYGSVGTSYPVQTADISYGLHQSQISPANVRYLAEPTPGAPNGDGVLGFVAETTTSQTRGFFIEPMAVEITTATPGATLVYTTDGSSPSPSHGTKVSPSDDQSIPVATVPIETTTTLRVMAFREDWLATTVTTQTYLYLEDVLQQDGDGLPDTWGHAGADYAIDPDVVNHPRYRDEIIDDFKVIPTLSLVTELDNWFSATRRQGIYPSGQSSPRPVSAELLLADGSEGFQVDGSVEIQGGSSTNRWKSDKLSMQLKFKREFGDAKLEYPLFGDAATDQFDTLILDARLNQAWHYGGGVEPTVQRARTQFTRDQYAADLQNLLGGRGPHGQFVHLYLNGMYWGLYNLHERPDEHFAAAYFGGDEDDYDVIKHKDTVVSGSFDSYQALINAVNRNVADGEPYEAVTAMLDIDQFIPYMLINYYLGNWDWAHHNWYATYNRVAPDGRWRFHSWDAEHILEDLGDDVTGRDDQLGPTHIHRRLMQNDEYRLKFMDAIQRHFFHDGLLTPERAAEIYQQRLDAVEQAVVPESARWGDNRRSRPYTRDIEWRAERNRLLKDYLPRRTETVIRQFRNRGFFHRFDAPALSQHGGPVHAGDRIEIAASVGELFYTTDGSDPRGSETAVAYTAPIVIDQDVTIRTRSRVDGQWSALVEGEFVVFRPGDFDGSDHLDATDIDLLFAAVRTGTDDPRFDVTGDDLVDSADTTFWLEELYGTRTGDANLDRRVDFSDFLRLVGHFGAAEVGWAQGDFNGDAQINFADFLQLSSGFGFVGDAPQPAAEGGALAAAIDELDEDAEDARI